MENLDQGNNKNVSLSLIAEYGASDSDSDDTETQSNDNTGNDDSDAAELSEMVLKNNIINACAHGPIARSSIIDDVETSRHMIIDSAESGVVEYEVTEYRHLDSDSDSSSDSSSDVDSVKDVEEVSSGDESKSKKVEPIKVNGELGLDDLPPIEDLAISLPSQECTKIGTIVSIVDRLVVVHAIPESPAVNLDSILFLENGAKALGKVFDVFGPVSEPHYCVRFNSAEHVRDRGVQPGMDVYIAPNSTDHTSYVFLSELMKAKGSDASWLDDNEPPATQVEYSDDEEERRANRAKKEQRQNRHEESDGETSRNQGRRQERRNQRPSESSSRFGSGPSRGRNPFSVGSRRINPNIVPRFSRPWVNMDMRTPPPHPSEGPAPFSAPPSFPPGVFPMFPPPMLPRTPPPLMSYSQFEFGARSNPPFRRGLVGPDSWHSAGPMPQWARPPQPPGT